MFWTVTKHAFSVTSESLQTQKQLTFSTLSKMEVAIGTTNTVKIGKGGNFKSGPIFNLF